MKRDIYDELLAWKTSQFRKPLMLYGARQVGKTYILKEFGRREYESVLYVNCFRNEPVKTLFQRIVDANEIFMGLSAITGVQVLPCKTLVFIDEIQEIPAAVSMLKYFCEQAPDIHVVVAGSLLGVLNLKGESFPVGKVDIKHLYPMSYGEFLSAIGREGLRDLLSSGDETAIDALSETYIEYLRQYYFVGGMPEAVRRFSIDKDLSAVRKIQQDILAAYEADFSKHADGQTQRIRQVWNSIPSQLARENKKFIFGALKKGARASEYELAIQWLVDAGLVIRVQKTKDAKMPLKFYADTSSFKLYLMDVGLLGAMFNAPSQQILIGDNVFCEYKGSFTENYVLQQFVKSGLKDIFYYSKDNSTLEVDFLLQNEASVLPVEVKAEDNVRSKSLRFFVQNEFPQYRLKGLRFSMKPHCDQDWMRNVPLYMADTYFSK